MAVLAMEAIRRKGMVRGRESRNQTLTTKLTPTEAAAVEAASRADGKTVGEWLRDLALRELPSASGQLSPLPLMGEITGIRLLLINTLEPLLRGDKMTPEQFKEMLRYVKTNKRKAAADTHSTASSCQRRVAAYPDSPSWGKDLAALLAGARRQSKALSVGRERLRQYRRSSRDHE